MRARHLADAENADERHVVENAVLGAGVHGIVGVAGFHLELAEVLLVEPVMADLNRQRVLERPAAAVGQRLQQPQPQRRRDGP